ncbi:MAG: hypothetical protein IPK57_15580 [Chitinophagaceae bacterium]|nr:hypothetical protein [Chitinophagaceae bacterium]
MESAGALVVAIYNIVPDLPGKKKNWDRMRTLFLPEGKLIATSLKTMGKKNNDGGGLYYAHPVLSWKRKGF